MYMDIAIAMYNFEFLFFETSPWTLVLPTHFQILAVSKWQELTYSSWFIHHSVVYQTCISYYISFLLLL